MAIDPSRMPSLQRPVGSAGVKGHVLSDPKDKLAYFRDNVQDPHETDDFDVSQYYYHRQDKDSNGYVSAVGQTSGVPGPFYNGSGAIPGASQPFVQPGLHTVAPAAMQQQGRPSGPQAGLIGSQAPSGAVSRQAFGAPGMQARSSAAPGGLSTIQQLTGNTSSQTAALMVPPQQQQHLSIALTANVQNPPRGLNSNQAAQNRAPLAVERPIAPQLGSQGFVSMGQLGSVNRAPVPTQQRTQLQNFAPPGPDGFSSGNLPFDMSDFPALSGANGQDKNGGSDFSIHNEADFPALPGFKEGSEQPKLGEDFTPQQMRAYQDIQTRDWSKVSPQQRPSVGSASENPTADRFGLLGLLNVIRMTDADLNTLALGTDLTTLGLSLNSPELLYETFASPFSDTPAHEPEFTLPSCYYLQPPLAPPASKMDHLSDESLFYVFYTVPFPGLQTVAARVLLSREWLYHKEHKLWFQRVPDTEHHKEANFERGSYVYFDVSAWERVRKDNVTLHNDKMLIGPDAVMRPKDEQLLSGVRRTIEKS